jgi:hypothetical protein
MEIHFAAWLFDRTLGDSLTNKGARHRLLSYYFLDDGGVTKDQLKEYVKTGRLDSRKTK